MVSDEGDHHVHGVAHRPGEFVGLRLYDETYQEAVDEGSAAERLVDREREKADALDDGRPEASADANEQDGADDEEEDAGYEGGEAYPY